MTFWQTPRWHQYEEACGQTAGDRHRLLSQAPWKTRVLDLSIGRDGIWKGMRKSYRQEVRKGQSRFGVGDLSFLPRMRALHLKAAGRNTRSDRSWEIQGEWVRDGIGMCLIAHDLRTGDDVAFAYIVRHEDWAYYFSAATLVPGAHHLLQWVAMCRLGACGVRWYETGWQGAAENEKEEGIEFFRRGFGGQDLPASWQSPQAGAQGLPGFPDGS